MTDLKIPYVEKLHDQPKGLFFIMHGHFGNKTFSNFLGLADKIFDLGYDVVSVDAYKHGDRKAVPYFENDPVLTTIEMLTVIEHTLSDIVYLYKTNYQNRTDKVSIVGTSMGGHIAYLLNRYLPIEFCIPIIGTPNLGLHYETKKKKILKERYTLIEEQVNRLTLKKEEFTPRFAFALQGDHDDTVSKEPSKAFIESFRKEQYIYKSYPCGHDLTQEMIEDIIQFVRMKV